MRAAFSNPRVMFAACITLVIASGALVLFLASERKSAEGWVAHTYQVQRALNDARILMLRAEVQKRGYLLGGTEPRRVEAQALQKQARKALQTVRRSTSDNPVQQDRIGRLLDLHNERQVASESAMDLMRRGDREGAANLLNSDQNQARLALWTDLISESDLHEQRLLDKRILAAQQLETQVKIAIGTTITLAFLFGVLLFIERRCRMRDLSALNRRLAEDVERRTHLEAELESARAKAESAVAAKSAFLANMSHEIRTPMNGVVGFADLLLQAQLPAEQHRHVQLIVDSGRAMMRLLNDILDLSKIEAGQMHIAAERVDLRHTLKSCFKLVRPAAEQKGLDFRSNVAVELPDYAKIDGLRLRQIVLNLLSNAVKFTERGGVTCHTRYAAGRTDMLEIAVSDTGVGIAPERLSAVFDNYVQAEQTTAHRFGGTGLGLPISQQLANLMGGTLSVQSDPGCGTTFTLRLPLTEVEAPLQEGPIASITTAETRSSRLLLAEDHDVNQELMKAMLNQLGHKVTVVGDGAQAIAAVTHARHAGEPFDLVLMDMQMPVMGGLEATQALRRAGETLPVLALTANAYADDVSACLAAGMQAHLAKPVQLSELAQAISRWANLDAPHKTPTRPALTISPRLQQRYEARKAELHRVADRVRAEANFSEGDVAELCDLLHKLAGTAGLFQERELGCRASELEQALEVAAYEDRQELVSKILGLRLVA